MRLHEPIEAILVFYDELLKGLPGALDDLELVERLKLTNEMDHLGVDYAGLVPFKVGL